MSIGGVLTRISVICSAYNMAEVFSFRQSIESILSQSVRDFEMIICDDGSHDSTRSVLESYASRDERIKIISNERNLGLAASLNRCIGLSRCEYIARHDLDDISHPNRFEKQLSFLEKNLDVALVGCGIYLFDKNGVHGKRELPRNVENEDFLFSSPYVHGSVMMRRSALLSVGRYRVSRITRRTEDYELFMRMQARFRGANLPDKLYYYLEDESARRRRKYRYRIDEAIVRARGFTTLGLMPRGIPYVLKPLIVGLIPDRLLRPMQKRYYERRSKDA